MSVAQGPLYLKGREMLVRYLFIFIHVFVTRQACIGLVYISRLCSQASLATGGRDIEKNNRFVMHVGKTGLVCHKHKVLS